MTPIPGYTKNGPYWYRDSDGAGPFGMDGATSPPTPYLVGDGATGNGGGFTTIQASAVGTTDASGTITTGGQQQLLMAALSTRRGYWIQNQSTGDLWINDLGLAAIASVPPQSLKLPAGAIYEAPITGCPTGALSIIGATTGQAFAARFW